MTNDGKDDMSTTENPAVAHDRRIRVLLVLESQGGSRRHVVDLIDGLDPARFELALVYGTSRMDEQFVADLPRLRRRALMIPCDDLVRPVSPRHELAALRQVRRAIRRFQPDVVHCHSSKAGIIGRLAARLEHVPAVFYTPHAYSFQAPEFAGRKRRVFVGLERWFARHATTRTFNVSEGERRAALAEGLGDPDHFRTIVNGVPDGPVPSRREARLALGVPAEAMDAPIVGVTARMVEQKDPLTFARVAARVIAAYPDVWFAYVGDGPLRGDFEECLREAGDDIAAHVLMPGYRTDADQIVAAFDVYLLTSLYEGMPYSLIEALRAGVPVVASHVTGNDEVVESGVNGALFAPGDDAAAARAVERLLLEAPLDKAAVRGSYLRRFTADAMVAAIAANYEEAVARTEVLRLASARSERHDGGARPGRQKDGARSGRRRSVTRSGRQRDGARSARPSSVVILSGAASSGEIEGSRSGEEADGGPSARCRSLRTTRERGLPGATRERGLPGATRERRSPWATWTWNRNHREGDDA